MENKNVEVMSAEALERDRLALCGKVEALPNRFSLNGHEFVWHEKMNYKPGTEAGKFKLESIPSLRISSTNHRDIEVSFEIGIDGSVQYYSFSSANGDSTEQAEKSRNFFETYAALLSEDFRQTVLRDYNEKLETLNSLKAEYEIISKEQRRRHEEAQAKQKEADEKETRERRNRLEAVGQVWFDYGYSPSVRYTVKETTDKTIVFYICSFNTQKEEWVIMDTKRISKHLLGQKPSRRYRDNPKVMVCPVGTDDLASQKTERPETVNY